jgi:hypothetical protein
MSACWRRPSLTAVEVLWRWMYGIPAAALIWFVAVHVVRSSGADLGELRRISLLDPERAAAILDRLWAALGPGTLRAMAWVVPILVVTWVIASALGRTLVLRRADRRLHARPGVLMALHGVRVTALAGSFAIWWALLEWAARVAIIKPIAIGRDPNAVLYAAIVIVATLGVFTFWAVASWALSIAPLIAMLHGSGVAASLRTAFCLGPIRGKLVEINLVMGIVKIALIVLAMVGSASPLPFQATVTPEFMAWWYACVTVAYLLACDFFHVVGLMAYLQMWRVYED